MKYWIRYFISIVGLSMGFTLLLWYFSPTHYQKTTFYSPLPSFLTRAENEQVSHLDLWLPQLAQSLASEQIHLTAQSVLMFDLTTEKVLFEQEPKKRLPMASLTKIMTAIIALENKKTDDKYTVVEEDLVGENSMGLEHGEIVSLDDLLYGIFLLSANDATEVIAHNFPGGRNAFIHAMNNKAQALGLTDTNFTNPSGLEGDGDQHTTAYDLLVMTRYLLDNYPKIITIASSPEIDLPSTSHHKEYYFVNETNLITSYPGVKGLKTGYTPEAGLCLVTYYEDNGHKIVGILLGSENRRAEMKELLDYSLTSLSIKPPKHD
ncbi:hypothetical protein BH11PAT1_BH11PAT1_6050 [soil metagenome]